MLGPIRLPSELQQELADGLRLLALEAVTAELGARNAVGLRLGAADPEGKQPFHGTTDFCGGQLHIDLLVASRG